MSGSQASIGIDFGGTAIKYGLCSDDGNIHKVFKKPTDANAAPEAILETLVEAAHEARDYGQSAGIKISAIGLGTPGSVDVDRGFLRGGTPNFKLWKNVHIRGAGKEAKKIVCITLGTGIGGGIVIDDKVYRGSFCAGAEVGHMSIAYNGKKCRCGGIGCWELYASATAMIQHYHSLHPAASVMKAREIFERYDSKDPFAIQVVEEEIRMVAVGLANLVNIFNPRIVVIGGGLSEAGNWFIEKIAGTVRSLAMENSIEFVRIVRAQLGNKAGLLGAALLALEYAKENQIQIY
jgi:glucokinase